MLIFLHLPKTAGQSFRALLERVFPAQRLAHLNSVEERDRFLSAYAPGRFDAAIGHMPYGLHACLDEPCVYFTMLREPVDRYLSHYFFMRHNDQHPMHARLHREGLDLEAYLERIAPRRYMELNAQVKRLLDTSFVGTWWGVRRESELDVVGERASLGEADLVEAQRNLTEKIVHFGVYEQLERSMRLLAALLGGSLTDLPVVNATPRRAAVAEISPALLERIRAANHLDVRLYDFARAAFERQSTSVWRRHGAAARGRRTAAARAGGSAG